ncbi:MAG: hypothetical protein JNM07_05335 [Phycisphaerae bacterium]|nr:hypothetical protein [Phycisphaerae bacterium]
MSILNAPFRLFSAAAFASALMSASVAAQPAVKEPPRAERPAPPPGGPRDGRPGREGAEARGMEGAMNGLKRGLRDLKAALNDSNGTEAALTAVNQMQRACIAAKSARPEKLKGDDRVKALTAYRRSQMELMRLLMQAETEIMDGKTDAAKATVAKIEAHRDAAHDTFSVEEEHDHAPAAGTPPAGKK